MLLALECLIHHLSHETALRMDPERQARHDEQREQLMRDCEEENKFEEQLLRDIRTPRKYEAHLPDGWLPAHVLEVRIDGLVVPHIIEVEVLEEVRTFGTQGTLMPVLMTDQMI